MTVHLVRTSCLFLSLLFAHLATAQITRRVPADFITIQAAVKAAQEGDTVLVSPGIYYENVQLQGRNIVLTSRYFLDQNPALVIQQTIIDGSKPVHPDTASCILIWKKESAATVIQGFTLRGGKGTVWFDHYVPGNFREGGGILSEFSSPVIRHNIIRNNTVPAIGTNIISHGGGGIRCGDGAPLIENNYIVHNRAEGYGGGVVLNYCPGAVVRNNVIAFNYGGKSFSGGGFWASGADQTTLVTLTNNTIAYNESPAGGGGAAGGIFIQSIKLKMENNIVWGNKQASGKQVTSQGGSFQSTYNCIELGFNGTGNISVNPIFRDTVYFVPEIGSPTIDVGNPGADFNDFSTNSHIARFPARGGTRSDMGAYGGPNTARALFVPNNTGTVFSKVLNSPVVNTPGDSRSVNWIDIDGDNDLDLMITNGPEGGANNYLYTNKGKGLFTKVVNDPIVMDGKPSDGATWADYDNDGDNDCFVVNWYGVNNLLYQNKGNGTFDQILTGKIVNDGGFSETAAWGDYNNDGLLDLYVTNSGGDLRNFLYRNAGNGAFEKVLTGPMVTDAFSSRGVNWTDYDNDGDVDLFVTNESNQNEQLYKNTAGAFTKITGSPLIAAGGKTMSASWGDYNNDGFQDVFLANDQGNDALFRNDGNGVFVPVTGSPVVSSGGNSFGSQWADIDNDADLDLFVTNAFWGGPWRNFLYINQNDGTFIRDTNEIVSRETGWSYGHAFGDYDGDGDLDLAVANCLNAVQNDYLYENHSAESARHWAGILCTGKTSNRSAIGAKVTITAMINGQMRTQMREISAQSGHCGQNQLAAHFGLADATEIAVLVIHWPSGQKDTIRNLATDRYFYVLEGSGISSTAQPEAAKSDLKLLSPVPNPFSDSVECQFELAKPTTLLVEVTDIAGHTIRQLARQVFAAGQHTLHWDGHSAAGAVAGAGTYFIAFRSGSEVVTQVVVKVE